MASTFKSVEVTRGDFRYNEKGVYPLYGTYELAAALVQNDVIQMVNVPAGATVLFAQLFTDDLDTNQAPAIELDVGMGDDTNKFIRDALVGQAGGWVNSIEATYGNVDGFCYKFTADDTIDVKVKTAPGTGAATGTLTLMVLVCNDIQNV